MCLSEVAKGKKHDCTKSTKIVNIKEIISTNDNTEENIAAYILKKKCNEEENTALKLSQSGSGKKLRVQISPKEKENVQITIDDMHKIKTDFNISAIKTKRLARHLRVSSRNRKCLEPYLRERLNEVSHTFDSVFSVRDIDFNGNKSPVILCNDLEQFINDLIVRRNLTTDNVLFKVE